MSQTKLIFLHFLLSFSLATKAQIKVYPNPDPQNASGFNFKSSIFKVEVIQNGKSSESYIYNCKTNF